MSESEPTRDRTVAVATLELNREGPSPRGALTSADGPRVVGFLPHPADQPATSSKAA